MDAAKRQECREAKEMREVPEGRLKPDSYIANRVHCVWSTKERRKLIPAEMQPRLWSFIVGIARQNGIKPLAIGGFDEHAHALISIPAMMPLAKAVQLIKAGSSKWCNQNLGNGRFEWQAGYLAVSVSTSLIDRTQQYIRHQREHHAKCGFGEEWDEFLAKNGFSLEEES